MLAVFSFRKSKVVEYSRKFGKNCSLIYPMIVWQSLLLSYILLLYPLF